MNSNKIKRVVIAGGGTSGWITAAILSHQLGKVLDITLVESEEIGTIGVGESTVPPMRIFNKLLGIDEQEFMRETAATFKLAIWFENWGLKGDRYIHPFGVSGQSSWACEFHHFWLRSQKMGLTAGLGDYCVEWMAADQGKFFTGPEAKTNFAYHIDAALYAKFLRKLSERHGVKRVEGKIEKVNQNADSGFIESLTLASGEVIEGDLFIDCTGFRGLLIEQTLHTGFEDWSHWLPCDTAVAIQTENVGPVQPYTSAIAHDAGWRWNIPLQHRSGNGWVFCNRYMSVDEATSQLLAAVPGKQTRDPWTVKIRTGRRRKAWNKNCVAIGLAGGFVEPLEATSIHIIMMTAARLLHLFPFNGVDQSLVDQFNKETKAEIEEIRDFIVLHYNTTERQDTPFWRYCKNMEIPESLKLRIQLFKDVGHAIQNNGELFRVDSWVHVLLGQRVMPRSYHAAADVMEADRLQQYLGNFKAGVKNTVAVMPSHQKFLEQYCPARVDVWGKPKG
jgi:tryptophan 7-halogenase